MTLSQKLTGSLGLLLAIAAGLSSGCQKPDSGADIVPTVTIKPSTGGSEVASTGGAGDDEADGESGAPASSGEGGIGSLTGQVVIDGPFSALPPLLTAGNVEKDPAVCGAQDIPNETIVSGAGGGLANVFIYLEKPPSGAAIPEVPADPAIFDQKGCVFLPHAMFVRVKQTVKVLNDDPIAHNTHTYPLRSQAFNQLISSGDRVGLDLTYGQPEKIPVQVKCDIHTWMTAYHLPLEHPFAAVTDADGNFEIPDLPSGTHEFKVWHEKIGYVERAYKVTISGGAPTEVKISVGAAKLASFEGEHPKIVNISR
ncbi:MAG: hypothetical protein O2955_04905 [Planctomycetota bacterium]|nr:hypothetical protein [Planctomycetota bacterium]MDA1211831.1 hypothetical protein [Planctomycetota bacterium]